MQLTIYTVFTADAGCFPLCGEVESEGLEVGVVDVYSSSDVFNKL